MKKLSSNFTAFVKRDFSILGIIVLSILSYVFIKNNFLIAVPFLAFFWIGLLVRYFIIRRRMVEVYVDYAKKEILLDDLAGRKLTYQFSDLDNVRYKQGNRMKLFFRDGKSFSFFTKDLWLAELATEEGFKQNVREEIRKIQMLKFQS